MIKNVLGLTDDGVTVEKERLEKWSYKKYPPKSKYLLYKNIWFIILLTILVIIMNIGVACFDTDLCIPFLGCDFGFLLMIGGAIYEANTQWKHGKYWEV